jgi:glycosyltransferase involved in cell wall biosynthesis
MRVGIDLFEWATYPFRGIGRYEYSLATALAEMHGQQDNLIMLLPRDGDLPSAALRGQRCRTRLSLKQRKLAWLISNSLRVPLDRWLGDLDVFHAPDLIGPWLGYVPLIVTVHDLSPWIVPETRTQLNTWYFKLAFPISLKRARCIIVDSEAIKREVSSRMSVPEEKIVAVPIAANAAFTSRSDPDLFDGLRLRLGLRSSYFLAVGTFEPRKNHACLLKAFAALLVQEPSLRPLQLVLVGKPGWGYESIYEQINEFDLGNDLVLVQSLSDQELCQLYVHSAALVYPSFYEGFGLPVLEGMQCGTSVIASNIPVLREVAGEAALYIDPHDPRDLANAMRTVLDAGQRGDLIQHGLARARQFSWQETARRTWQVYMDCAARGRP